MKKNLTPIFLFFLCFISFFVRIVPYITHNDYFSADSTHDGLLVKYIQNTGRINWEDQYGVYPVLHSILFLFYSLSGIDFEAMMFYLIPLLFSFSLLFWYLFLKNHLGNELAFLSCLFIALFGPNIWWTSQTVRESFGLLMFPIVVYFFDKSTSKEFVPFFIISSVLMVCSHHWSSLMTLLFLSGMLSSAKYRDRWHITAYFLFLTILLSYWLFVSQYIITLLNAVLYSLRDKIIVLLISVILLIIFVKLTYRYLESFIRNERLANALNVILLLLLLFFVFNTPLFYRLTAFKYPPQEYLSIFFLAFFAIFGYRETVLKHYNTFKITAVIIFLLSLLIIFPLLTGRYSDSGYDPIRTLEFIVYPLSVFSAVGLYCYCTMIKPHYKFIFSSLIVFIVFFGFWSYPPILLNGQVYPNSPIFDIRSYVKWVDTKALDLLINWSKSNNFGIKAPNFLVWNKIVSSGYLGNNGVVLSSNDINLYKNIDKITSFSLGSPDPSIIINESLYLDTVYSNNGAEIYRSEISESSPYYSSYYG